MSGCAQFEGEAMITNKQSQESDMTPDSATKRPLYRLVRTGRYGNYEHARPMIQIIKILVYVRFIIGLFYFFTCD